MVRIPCSYPYSCRYLLKTSVIGICSFQKMRLLHVLLLPCRRTFATNASVKLNTLQENIKYFKNIYGKFLLRYFNINLTHSSSRSQQTANV